MDYVAAIDIGSTNLKCQIFSSEFRVVGSSMQKVSILYLKYLVHYIALVVQCIFPVIKILFLFLLE